MTAKHRNPKKKPHQKFSPLQTNIPRGAQRAQGYNTENLVWNLDLIDNNGPWSFDDLKAIMWLRHICPALHNFTTMRWCDILGTRHHSIGVDQIIPKAQRRLETIYETDCLCSLSLGGRLRIWGVKDGATFMVLWWDSNHEICPSLPCNT